MFTPFFQIEYKIARGGFSGRLKETFLVLSDDEARAPEPPEAGSLSLGARLRDPRRDRGQKNPRAASDTMSVDSQAKRADKTRSGEKQRR